jgi:HAMP domain-containing protein
MFAQYFTDEAGVLARNPYDPDWPRWLKSEFRFAAQFGGATVTINLSPQDATQAEISAFRKSIAGMSQGWERALDALDSRLNRPEACI